tara:strand:- start:57 stop:194 length:138 start_codon:yes stop_codon:yes gene_type:complete
MVINPNKDKNKVNIPNAIGAPKSDINELKIVKLMKLGRCGKGYFE